MAAVGGKKVLVAGCVILAVYAVIAVFAPVIAPYDAYADRALPYLPPSPSHLLGTNDIGQDILSELIAGARQSLIIGLIAAAISLSIGAVVGILAGWFGGIVDSALSAICSFFMTIPFFPLVILLSALIGAGALTPAIILGFLGWPEAARVLRAQTLALRQRQYILDIRAMGAGSLHILTRHVLRELLPICTYRFILAFRSGVLAEATLSFLGLGSPIAKSWGNMLYYAQARNAFVTGTWKWWAIPPGLALAVLVFALLLVSYYFEETSDPRLISKTI